MTTAIENKYHWNEDTHCWERVDHVQEYRGHKIETITWHMDDHWDRHREYRVTFPSGRVSSWGINKRGGNIRNLKDWIDFNYENNRTEYL